MKELKAKRVPPGDRWALTEVLNAIYMDTGLGQFYLDAQKGEVHVEDGKEKPEPIKKYSLYGEEY